jgi:ribose transport system substrate-binding protein
MNRTKALNVLLALVLVIPILITAQPVHAQQPRTYGIATLALDNDFWVSSNDELEKSILAKDPKANIVKVNANYDPAKQISQIEDMIQRKVDCIFFSATDPVALTDVVVKADKAGIPMFQWDNYTPLAPVKMAAMSNNYAMGYENAMFIARRLKGKGNVIAVNLPNNTTWWNRTLGMYDAFAVFPDIKLVDEWMYQPGSVGALTPRQAVESMMQKHPDVNAVWCAWDQAAIDTAELLIAKGKTDVFTTGVDGFEQTLDYIRRGTPLAATMGQSPRTMARTIVDYAFRYFDKKDTKLPQMVITPVYQFTKDRVPAAGLGPMGYDAPPYIREHLDIMWRNL